jgi:hypothetical protein
MRSEKSKIQQREYQREHSRERYWTEPTYRERKKEQGKQWYKLHPTYHKDKYKNNIEVREQDKKRTKEYKQKYPNRRLANVLLCQAIKKGKIIKPTHCSKCGKAGKIEGHHEDYSKPLEVIWLCKACHNYTRKGIKHNAD